MGRTLSLLLLASLISGCASSSADRATLDCAALRQVVASAAEEFRSISRPRQVTRYGDFHKVSLQAFGDCSVLRTAGRPRYLCSAESSDQVADRAQLVDAVQGCLGAGWKRTELAGGGARFEHEGVTISVGKSDVEAAHDSSVGLVVQPAP